MTIRAKAIGTVIENNDRVTLTEWRFAPGAETGWHRHTMDYVVIYQTPAHLSVETKEGVVSAQMPQGQSYFRAAGAEHNIVNAGNGELVFLELELK